MSIDRFNINPDLGFCQAVTVTGPGRTIYVSGNVGFGDDGEVVSGGMEAEARATFANIERTLESLGASLSDIVKINAFITDISASREYSQVRRELFGEHAPASATVQVAGLNRGAHIEIDAVAFLPEG